MTLQKLRFIFLLSLSLGVVVPSLKAQNPPGSFATIVQPLLPAVVNISTTSEMKDRYGPELPNIPEDHPLYEFFRRFMDEQQLNRPRKATALGSGFIISPDGHIVTNNHLIAEADEIKIILHDKRELMAEILGRDPRTDLALLKVTSKEKLPYVQWGDSDKSRVGDWVIAIGNPFGLGSTVTLGIISSMARDISLRVRQQSPASYVEGYIQTDASINVGNSGGPMFNLDGKVIGINTAILSPSGGNVGIGFAVPAALAKGVVDQLKQYGRTRRGWLGVQIQKVDQKIAESFGLKEPRGALVGSINKKGPAEKSGLKTGHIILEFNNMPVKESGGLPRIVGESPIGKEVPVVIWRGGKTLTLQAVVGEFEEAAEKGLIPTFGEQPKDKVKKALGFNLRALTPADRARLNLGNDIKGVLIAGVDPYSEAFEKGFRGGDLIVEVGHREVNTPEEVIQAIEQARKQKKNDILLLMRRGNDLLFLTLSVESESKPARKSPKHKKTE